MLAAAGILGSATIQPYTRIASLDGYKYLIDCDTVHAIDRFFMSECSMNMTNTDIAYAMDLIAYEDTKVGRLDVISLDEMMTMMVVSGKDCVTLQGEISGCN